MRTSVSTCQQGLNMSGLCGHGRSELGLQCTCTLGTILIPKQTLGPPVRMFLNASSTLVESKAEVSMKDKLFFSGKEKIVSWIWLPQPSPRTPFQDYTCPPA